MNLAKRHLFDLAAIAILVLSAGCSGRDPAGLEIARARIDPLVFGDDYGADVYFQAFFQTHLTAVELDSVYAYGGYAPDGAKSLKVNVPPKGSALGVYSGGVLTSAASRDLADFNALTFYARSDVDVSLNVAGFGNDNTGTSRYEAGRGRLPLTREWTFFVVPIPAPSKLIAERGMFTFAEGLEEQPPGVFPYPDGYNIWFDEIRFAKLGNVSVFRANMTSSSRGYFIGSKATVENTSTIFDVDGGFVVVDHSPNYFDYASSAPSVAAVTARGEIEIVGAGQAAITAKLEDVDVFGALNLTAYSTPTLPAESPTIPAANVISMFSDVYNDVPVETWRTDWSRAQFEEYAVAGEKTKMYSALIYVGISFENAPIDATSMNYFHLDVYAPAGSNFKVKLVSFPPGLSGSVETPDLVLDADTTPAFNAGSWSPITIPLTDFQLPVSWDWARIGQLVLSTTDARLVLVDNVYWHE